MGVSTGAAVAEDAAAADVAAAGRSPSSARVLQGRDWKRNPHEYG